MPAPFRPFCLDPGPDCQAKRRQTSGSRLRWPSLGPRFIEKAKRGGFAVFDGDFDGALGAVQQVAGALAECEALLHDCLDLRRSIGNGVRNWDRQKIAFADARMLRTVLTPFQDGLNRSAAKERQ